jgi:uncharacterized protein YtpQ (UPF0354 family)
MRSFCLMLLILCVSSIAVAQNKISKSEFTAKFIEQVKPISPDADFTIVSDLLIDSVDKQGMKSYIDLGNSYDSYLSGTRDLDQLILDRVASQKNIQRTLENMEVRSILPVIKNVHFMKKVQQQIKKAGHDESAFPFYYEKLNDDLYLMFAFDDENSMKFVSTADINKLGLTETIRDIAAKNISAHYQSVNATLKEMDKGAQGRFFIFQADESYEASILTALEFIQPESMNFKGDVVVFIPARNIALLADAGDQKSIEIATHIAQEGFKELGYSISPFGYIFKEGKWQRL